MAVLLGPTVGRVLAGCAVLRGGLAAGKHQRNLRPQQSVFQAWRTALAVCRGRPDGPAGTVRHARCGGQTPGHPPDVTNARCATERGPQASHALPAGTFRAARVGTIRHCNHVLMDRRHTRLNADGAPPTSQSASLPPASPSTSAGSSGRPARTQFHAAPRWPRRAADAPKPHRQAAALASCCHSADLRTDGGRARLLPRVNRAERLRLNAFA